MKRTHTPGPWYSARMGGIPFVCADAPGGQISLATVQPNAPAHTKLPASANARLMAAAPSLLAALERLVEAVDPAVGNNLPPGLIDAAIDALLAIAKATAKEPQA